MSAVLSALTTILAAIGMTVLLLGWWLLGLLGVALLTSLVIALLWSARKTRPDA